MINEPLKPGDVLVSTEEYFEAHREHAIWMVMEVALEQFDAILEWSSNENDLDENNERFKDYQPGYRLTFFMPEYKNMFVNIS